MIPIAYREDATIRDWLSQKSWLKPTPQGLLCRFCTQSVTSRTCLFVGKPFPYDDHRRIAARISDHEKTQNHKDQERIASVAARSRVFGFSSFEGDLRFRANHFLPFRDYVRVRNWILGRRPGDFKTHVQTETSGGLVKPSDLL